MAARARIIYKYCCYFLTFDVLFVKTLFATQKYCTRLSSVSRKLSPVHSIRVDFITVEELEETDLAKMDNNAGTRWYSYCALLVC